MIIRIFDLETTGFTAPEAKVVEIGYVDLVATRTDLAGKPSGWEIDKKIGSALVNPGIPIPPVASAVHHLIDEDVESALPWETVCEGFFPPADPVIAYAAHNMKMERQWITDQLTGGGTVDLYLQGLAPGLARRSVSFQPSVTVLATSRRLEPRSRCWRPSRRPGCLRHRASPSRDARSCPVRDTDRMELRACAADPLPHRQGARQTLVRRRFRLLALAARQGLRRRREVYRAASPRAEGEGRMMINSPQFTSAHALVAHYRAVSQRLAESGLPVLPDAPPLVPDPEPVQIVPKELPAPTIEQRIAETILLAQSLIARYPLLSKIVAVRRAASRCFGVPERDLIKPCREPWCTVPRQLAMAIATLITNKSRGEIGYFFGGRDRSTVWHAVQKYSAVVVRVRDEMTVGESHG